MSTSATFTEHAAKELATMIASQRKRCLDHARRLRANLTEDDITQPHDFPELATNPAWQYEDGILAGLLRAELVLRRLTREREA